MKRYDVVIKNGTVALDSESCRIDIGIRDGQIAALTEPGALSGEEIHNASGQLVLPGAIDMHVHFREPGFTEKEDFAHGTAAAACGGVTTVCDMPNTHPPVVNPERFAAKLERVGKSAYVDFGLWAGGTQIEHFGAMDSLGAIGLKIYMNRAIRATDPYSRELSMPDDAAFVNTLRAAAELDWPVSVHLANSAIDEAKREELQAGGFSAAADVCCSYRSPASVEALNRAALFARLTGARLHIAHISLNSVNAVDALIDAREQGANITAEVVPPALSFEELDKFGPMGIPFAHPVDELDKYWRALACGVIDVVATDHAPHTRAEKEANRTTPWKAPPGYPGVETSLPILVDAMLNGRIGIDVLVKISAANPARILALGNKGAILPGRDADLVIVDPEAEWVIDEAKLHSKAGWTPFHGRRLKGRVKTTILRGRVVARDGELVATPPCGQLVRRKSPRAPWAGSAPARSSRAGVAGRRRSAAGFVCTET